MQKVLRIAAHTKSFWRLGRKFTSQPIDIPVDEFTEDQIKVLKDDKMLTVVETEAEVETGISEDDEKRLMEAVRKAFEADPKQKPTVSALEKELGFDVAGKVLNAVWLAVKNENKD